MLCMVSQSVDAIYRTPSAANSHDAASGSAPYTRSLKLHHASSQQMECGILRQLIVIPCKASCSLMNTCTTMQLFSIYYNTSEQKRQHFYLAPTLSACYTRVCLIHRSAQLIQPGGGYGYASL